MSAFTLYVGDHNLSSWSLRAYLALAHTGQPFEKVLILLDRPDTQAQIRKVSPSGRVPALKHGSLVVWDSLAIAEYLAELFPEAKLWPADRAARALARSASAEMHAGFAELRKDLPMNLLARTPKPPSPAARADVARVVELWRECRRAHGAGGPFLFGSFTVADAMYAPVVTRFVTYDVPVDPEIRAYLDAILADPPMKRWTEAAKRDRADGV